MGRVLEEQQNRMVQLATGNSAKMSPRIPMESVDLLVYKTQQAVYPSQTDSNDINAQLQQLLRDDGDTHPSSGNFLSAYADTYVRDGQIHDSSNDSSHNGTVRRSALNNRLYMPASNSVPTYLNTSVQVSFGFFSSLFLHSSYHLDL